MRNDSPDDSRESTYTAENGDFRVFLGTTKNPANCDVDAEIMSAFGGPIPVCESQRDPRGDRLSTSPFFAAHSPRVRASTLEGYRETSRHVDGCGFSLPPVISGHLCRHRLLHSCLDPRSAPPCMPSPLDNMCSRWVSGQGCQPWSTPVPPSPRSTAHASGVT